MRTYNANEWQFSSKGQLTIPLTTKDFLELDIVGTGTISVDGVLPTGEVGPIICQLHHVHVKHKFNGFIELHIHSNKSFGYRLVNTAKQIGEPMDDRTPPPPKEPTNILQQMRSVVRQELAANRESFLVNDTGLPGHEIDDDNDDFEEEMVAQAQAAAQAAADKLDNEGKSPPPDGSKQPPEGKKTNEPQQPPETPPAS